MARIITILTDFGTVDGYVGEMKGVLLSRAPDVVLVDITHDIPAQDVECGRLALARVWRRFPVGSIHVAIVDPGVGSTRAALAVESNGHFLLGPDNGILSPALLTADALAVGLAIPPGTAPTFHGRDVFAPAGAALAKGARLEALGPVVTSPIILRTPEPHRGAEGVLCGQVIAIDRFGNAITNLLALHDGVIEVGSHVVPLSRTYADVPTGVLVAVVGSSGMIELAVRDGSAALALGVKRGTPVILKPH